MAGSGWIKPPSIAPLLKYMDHHEIEVGILSNAPDYPDGTSIIKVAVWNEFGGDNGVPPARHAIGKSINKDKAYYKTALKGILKHPGGAYRDMLLKHLGKTAVELVQANIEGNLIGMQDNADSTANKKGGNTPMIDTQHFIRSIDYRLIKHEHP